jgi:hypothetical protein
MPTIAEANQNNIRPAMDVFIHVQQLQNTVLTVSQNSGKIADLTTLQDSDIGIRKLTDLQGAGFPLDGSCVLYDSTVVASADNGKIGIRSNVGSAMTVTVSASVTINALTLRVSGIGTITANSVAYEIREFMVIPVNATNITLTVTPEAGNRIVIEDISAGIVLDFDNDNLVSCTLDLESDLSIVDTSWRISSIEVSGYYPDDISEAVSNMTDGTPIIYQAGYAGDYSIPRYFYVSEIVTQKNNLITIKGEDASSRFDAYTQPEEIWQTTRKNARQQWYRKMASLVKNAGITLYSQEADPPIVGTNATKYAVITKEASYRDYIQYMMDMTNKNGFYPRFIDAGIPTLRWSEPAPVWDIYKEDIGDFERTVERNVNKIYGDDANFSLQALLSIATNKTTISTQNVTKNKVYNISYGDNYYNSVTYSNGTLKKASDKTLHSIKLTAKKTTKKVKVKVKAKGKTTTKTISKPKLEVYGYKITEASGAVNMVTANRLGVTKEEKNLLWGRFVSNYNGSSYGIPNYADLFNKSNVGGSFTFKGNPHMQPRDVFRLYELDGETFTVCTIESIETTHEDGGMKSVITFREGVY